MSLANSIFDFALALPFAVALTLHDRILARPNFHLASVFAFVPLLASELEVSISPLAVLFCCVLAGVVFTWFNDFVVAKLVRGPSGSVAAHSFFVSATVYLLSVQVFLILFGAAPRSLQLLTQQTWTALGITIDSASWILVAAGGVLAGLLCVLYDSPKGDRWKISSGEARDAIGLGIPVDRIQLITIVAIGLILSIASLARAYLIPFSIDSTFNTFIICFTAAAIAQTGRAISIVPILFVIYSLRSIFTSNFSPVFADALTLTIVLMALSVVMSRRFSARVT